jgi:hypothetical protein
MRKRPAATGFRRMPIELTTRSAMGVGSPHFGQALAAGDNGAVQ